MKKGQKIINPSFTIFFTTNNHNNCRFGISTPIKLIKLATDRNFYKRQVRGMLISHLKEHHDSCQISDNHLHYDFVIIIRYSYLKNDFPTNQDNLYKLLLSAYREKSNFQPEK